MHSTKKKHLRWSIVLNIVMAHTTTSSTMAPPFYDNSGTFQEYIGSCYDINETKKYILEIKEMNKTMVNRELKMVELKKEIQKL